MEPIGAFEECSETTASCHCNLAAALSRLHELTKTLRSLLLSDVLLRIPRCRNELSIPDLPSAHRLGHLLIQFTQLVNSQSYSANLEADPRIHGAIILADRPRPVPTPSCLETYIYRVVNQLLDHGSSPLLSISAVPRTSPVTHRMTLRSGKQGVKGRTEGIAK